ncbi:MAG: PKD domain-containing protein, partial [bacterium]|nr:PKD domain-containing protein [bacterium]
MQRFLRPWQRAISTLIIISFLNLQIVPSILAKEDQNPPVNPAQVVDGIYPIALKKENIQNLSIGSIIENILNGYGPGNFGWLTWTGDRREPILAKALIPPGTVDSYLNPFNNEDHALNCGDWVKGLTGVKTSSAVRSAIEQLKNKQIVVPVWDEGKRVGDLSLYHIIGLAKVKIIDSDNKRIRAIYCGIVENEPTNHPPAANAGPDQNVVTGATVNLDGSASTDPDNDILTYHWTLSGKPQGSNAALTGADTVTPDIVPDIAGTYEIQLVVNDGVQNSAPSSVHINAIDVVNHAPVAVAEAQVVVDDFSSPGLDPAWEIWPGWEGIGGPGGPYGSYVVENGALKYYVSAMQHDSSYYDASGPDWQGIDYYPGLLLARPFQGEDWTFETKINYYMPNSTGRGLSTQIWIGEDGVRPSMDNSGNNNGRETFGLYIYRYSDQAGYGTNTDILQIGASSGQITTVPVNNTYFKINRKGKVFTVMCSSDGAHYETALTVTAPAAIYGKTQKIVIGGRSFYFPAGSYSEYEYIRLTGKTQSPIGVAVRLDGSKSTDEDNDALSYHWSLLAKPQGSLAELQDASAVTPSLTPDKVGKYEVQLIVNDGRQDSLSSAISINTPNQPPVAVSGANIRGNVGDIAHLDGSGSHDLEGDILHYRWSFVSMPEGSTATLVDATTVNPSFTIDKAGTYEVKLIVNDGQLDSLSDSVYVSSNHVPTARIKTDRDIIAEEFSSPFLDSAWQVWPG